MAKDININESAILEMLNEKIDYDGGNYKGSGLSKYVVDKSGDIMTGNLILKSDTNYLGVSLYSANSISSTAPSNWTGFGSINIFDANNVLSGYIQSAQQTNQLVTTSIGARRQIDGNNKTSSISVSVDGSGNALFDFPKCTTKATTTSSARSDKVAVVVQNYVNGTSWYRVWSDGWIEQGGSPNYGGNTATTVTFLKAFSNTNYTITVAHAKGSGWTNGANANFYNKATNSVAIYQCDGSGVSWYACGY